MRALGLLASLVVVTVLVEPAEAQLPGLLTAPAKPASTKPAKGGAIAAPTKDNPDATVAETAGPIAVDNTVSDRDVRRNCSSCCPGIRAWRT